MTRLRLRPTEGGDDVCLDELACTLRVDGASEMRAEICLDAIDARMECERDLRASSFAIMTTHWSCTDSDEVKTYLFSRLPLPPVCAPTRG
jgi:hypothetical protein